VWVNILGINAFNKDPSACLIKDGKVVAAVEEEKISRQKHIVGFPGRSIRECLSLGGIRPSEVEAVALPRRHLFELRCHLLHLLRYFPKSLNLLKKGSAALDLGVKYGRYFHLRKILRKILNRDIKIIEIPHHVAHASAVYYQSEFEDPMVVVIDAMAEYDTLWVGEVRQGDIIGRATSKFPNSLGMTYAAVTDFLGFRAFSDEWKVMAMAAYGLPKYYEELNSIISIDHDMRVRLDHDVFDFKCYGRQRWFSNKFPLLDCQRPPSAEIEQKHFDFARSFQNVLEDKMLDLFRQLRASWPRHRHLCLSGGVFLNCLFNGKLVEEGLYEDVYVDCNPGDGGSSLGAACYIHKELTGRYPERLGHDNRLGRAFTPGEVRRTLERAGLKHTELSSVSDVAQHLGRNNIMGIFEGRSEFGPRALGSRSIIADPRNAETGELLNSRVKYRESFRPYAPSILIEHQNEYFAPEVFSPYMSFAIHAKPDVGEMIPAVVHADGTSRIQSVTRDKNPFFHELLSAFYRDGGVPLCLNTSFNIRGEPIVYTPTDAIGTLRKANLDVLVLWPFLITQ